jgi:hypothetical protein
MTTAMTEVKSVTPRGRPPPEPDRKRSLWVVIVANNFPPVFCCRLSSVFVIEAKYLKVRFAFSLVSKNQFGLAIFFLFFFRGTSSLFISLTSFHRARMFKACFNLSPFVYPRNGNLI